MQLPEESLLFDPFMLPRYLRLNAAIEQFTGDMVARDPAVFRRGRSDFRYVAERQLFFATFADSKVHDYFVAQQTHNQLPDEGDLPFLSQKIVPYFRGSHPAFREPLDLKSRLLRYLYRHHGRASIRMEGCGEDRPQVLFLAIHPKFVRYLMPIAEKLGVPYGFLTVEDPEMFEALGRHGLPRIALELTAETSAMVAPVVDIFSEKIRPDFFEAWFIRSNAVRRALREMGPRCIVVPEGNAAIYELVNQSGKAVGIPTVCVQQGWAPVVHPGFRNMSYAKMFVWGPAFSEMLAPYNPAQRFVATGNHVVACQPQGDVGTRKAIAFFLQNGAHWITKAAARGMLDLIVWTAERFPDREIRVRQHPGEPLPEADLAALTRVENIRLMFPETYSLKEVLRECRIAVAINSTTILEAIASGVVPLILDIGGFGPYHPNVAADGAAIEVQDLDAARVELERLVSDDQFCASFAPRLDSARQRLFARDSEPALEAIVAEILDSSGLRRRTAARRDGGRTADSGSEHGICGCNGRSV
jgi:hypothetical protein